MTVRTGSGLRTLARGAAGRLVATFAGGEEIVADRVLLATGGGKSSAGLAAAAHLGHEILPAAPSSSPSTSSDPRLRGLEGLSVPAATAAVQGSRLRETGPVLITHWGLSGPAILRLSAWGARELLQSDYQFTLTVNWSEPAGGRPGPRPGWRPIGRRTRSARWRPPIPSGSRRASGSGWWWRPGSGEGVTWSMVSNDRLRALVEQATAGVFAVAGKSMNKEES